MVGNQNPRLVWVFSLEKISHEDEWKEMLYCLQIFEGLSSG